MILLARMSSGSAQRIIGEALGTTIFFFFFLSSTVLLADGIGVLISGAEDFWKFIFFQIQTDTSLPNSVLHLKICLINTSVCNGVFSALNSWEQSGPLVIKN